LSKNYYEILGIAKDAELSDVKKAYRDLSKKHHPDVGGDEEKFKELSEAYATLSNPQKRANYDNPMRGHSGGFNPFGDIFGGMGGHMRPPNPNAPRRGRNIVLENEVALRYFIFGGKLKVKFSFRDPCPDCGGTGAEEKVTCSNCKGAGQTIETHRDRGVFMQSSRACPACMGRGFVASKKCGPCTGSGSRIVDKDLVLDVPVGAKEGSVVGAGGEGGIGMNGGPPGDLLVKLHIKVPKRDELTEEQRMVLEEL
jgi:molecular chaperone DnaJ